MEREIVELRPHVLRNLIHLCLHSSLVCEVEIQSYTEFGESFALESFPGWKAFFMQMIENNIEEPNVTANAITVGALLFYFRKFKSKYT